MKLTDFKALAAVVSNKPSVGLIGNKLGSWIDERQFVVRLNDARINNGFGKRTDLHIIGSCRCLTVVPDAKQVIDYRKFQKGLPPYDGHVNKVLVQHLQGAVPSTGLLAVGKLIHQVKLRPVVIGFDSSWGCKQYDGKPEDAKLDKRTGELWMGVNFSHVFTREEELLRHWHKNGIIYLLQKDEAEQLFKECT